MKNSVRDVDVERINYYLTEVMRYLLLNQY